MNLSHDWKQSNIQTFWGEIAACHHLVQFYENERVFIETLEGFAGSGFLTGESVVVVATPAHLLALNSRLKNQGFQLEALISKQQYIPVDAEQLLQKLLPKTKLVKNLLSEFTSGILCTASRNGRKLRIFGEMVALLWASGRSKEAIELEHFWCDFLEEHEVSVYCAYPESGFTDDDGLPLKEIFSSHSTVIGGWSKPSTEIYYKPALVNN